MRNYLLIPLLALFACTHETPSANPASADDQPAEEAAASHEVSEEAKAAAAKAMDDRAIASGSKPLISGKISQQPKYQPKRKPTFGFEATGGITEEQLADYYVVMSCEVDGKDVGQIFIEMWPQFAPSTVRNFLRYSDEGFYDGLGFHRIIRNFMMQGGDPIGDGSGDGPHGSIRAEFSNDPARKHGYGVLSMARGNSPNSASSQFFLCCGESPSTWGLDGKYASFGKVVGGVDAIEAMANVPVGGPQQSSPMRSVKMVKVEVVKGKAPKGKKKIERPAPDLKGEPAKVNVQHILISFAGTGIPGVTRTKEEAKALAQEIFEKARLGEDFSALVKEHSDDPVKPGDALPGSYYMTNIGVQDIAWDRAAFGKQNELVAKIEAKQLTREKAIEQFQAFMAELGPQPMARAQMVSAFGDVSFSLKVGEIGMADFSSTASKFGWHIIRRVN